MSSERRFYETRSFVAEIMSSELAARRELEERNEPKRRFGFLIECVTVLVLGVVLALGLHVFVTQVYAISGQSMEPTFHNGQRVVISKLSPGILDVERGDVVIFRSPRDPNKNLIKRVIAIPGDQVALRDGVVYLNNAPLDEDYVKAELGRYARDVGPIEVPRNKLFVLGDNRPASQDSRDFGLVGVDAVRGTVFLRLWPLDSFTAFP